MPMLCSNCGETKPEQKFFLRAHNRFVAFCEECRALASAQHVPPDKIATRIEARPRVVPGPARTTRKRDEPNVRPVPDQPLVRDLLFVLAQL